ncbi:MAG: peptide deformylase [Candidatus Gracilibacteria bacterium]
MRLTIQTGTDNPILRAVSKPVKITELHTCKALSEAMLNYIKNPKHHGIGLAAPQVGINKRLIVAGLPTQRDEEGYPLVVMINPTILSSSKATLIDEEGCLSLPGITGNIERSTTIEIEWIDIKGRKMKKKITGFGARVVQHEIDHLDGVLISDKFLK